MSGAVPPGLSERNYVFFDTYERSGLVDEDAFDAAIVKLETAFNITEILWVREHTKWVARAAEWNWVEPRVLKASSCRQTTLPQSRPGHV